MQLLHLHAGHMATAICRSLFRPATHSSVSFCLSFKLCTFSSVLAERPCRNWQSFSDRSAVAVAASAFLPTHRTSAAIFLSLASPVEGEYGRPFFTAFFARARTLFDCLAFCWVACWAFLWARCFAVFVAPALWHEGFLWMFFKAPCLHRVLRAGFFRIFFIQIPMLCFAIHKAKLARRLLVLNPGCMRSVTKQ